MDLLGAVLIVAAVAATSVVITRNKAWKGRRARAEKDSQLAMAKRTAAADVVGLVEALNRLVAVTENDPVAKAEFQHAEAARLRAVRCLHEATEPDELCLVTENLEEGRWTVARLAARAAGEPMPSRRPPCFFNPGHGPSARNIHWHGLSVPACSADAARVDAGADPYIRTVERDSHRVPYWEGGPAYAGWARGYYTPWRGSTLVADIVSQV